MLESILYFYIENKISKHTFITILKSFVKEVKIDNKSTHPYGSWKDIKLFLNHLINNNKNIEFIIDEIIQEIYIPQMIEDRKNMSINLPISLCGKWLPRESSKEFGWLARKIAINYYNYVFCLTNKNYIKYSHYRKLCSSFNNYLDIPQNHMCSKHWDYIKFNKVTAQTILKSKKSFLNDKEINENHRIICKENFLNYIQEIKNKNKPLKGKNIMPHYLVKEICSTNNLSNNEKDIINLQWNGLLESLNKNKYNFMKNCIPCIDVSPSMYNSSYDPLYSSIGMGLLTMELSDIKRAFTFSNNPNWITFNKQEEDSFYNKVIKIMNSEWGGNTNIIKMFELMLDKCIENNISNKEISKYSLIIFSDMQFDETCQEGEECIIDTISKKYKEKGYNSIPYLIFWNLRQTNNFPTIEKTPYSTKLSGNNGSLLKLFMNTNLEKIKQMSNITLIMEILDNPRYNIF